MTVVKPRFFPHLARLLACLSIWVISACSLWPAEKRLLSSHRYVRARTLESVKAWPIEKQKPVIAALVSTFGQDDNVIVHRAQEALVGLGQPATPALIEALTASDPFTRVMAASTLGDIPPTPEALAALTPALQDPHPLVREEAAHSLERLQEKSFKTS